MVTMLEDSTSEKQCSDVHFFVSKRAQCKEYSEMLPVYGGKCLSHKVVHNWVEKFSQGCSKIADEARPGHPVETATETTVQMVEQLIRADRRITIDNVATALGCSQGLAYSRMHDCSMFRKVCAQWVLRELKDREKIKT
jgi:transposase